MLLSYRKAQEYLPKFVRLTNVDPNRIGGVRLVNQWLDADQQSLTKVKELRARFPDTAKYLNDGFFASANGFGSENLSASVTKSALPPVSPEEMARAEQDKTKSAVILKISDVVFDPNGLTEMRVKFDLMNPGPPTVIRNWRLTVYDGEKMILAAFSPRTVWTRTRFKGPREMPDVENLADTPLERGGMRKDCGLGFTFYRNVAADLFDKPEMRFRVTADDIYGNEIAAEFSRG
jgi:hypothetical protein